ncbi:thioredoxin family protein [Alicyclobacillus fastidiosus]|uniref:Thioredoxin family protein n=1 Tax=Alicyclobacillus fastidiosus TaxID=392011 RepID=A0ABY6ZHS6_9BACL|nr:thioredoxin family protein [Alicyclobacillus fastidiosus]WAH41681.1 thioredoxin family protein [Alicyclobacillus fastidiosus]GMA63360.1 thiol reductase thioredoxin [Alicyclobacillus fastidiosus]
MFTELNYTEVLAIGSRHSRAAVFFYTPLCGTCKLARRMLEIVDAAIPGLTIYTCDANFARPLLESWKIQSVPALVYIDEGKPVDIQFAFSGVDELYTRLKEFFA